MKYIKENELLLPRHVKLCIFELDYTFWSVSCPRRWCQNCFSMTKAHHHHGHHNHRHYDKHNGVDQLYIYFFLSLCQRPVFSVTCPGNSFISHTQLSCKLHHWAFTPNVYGGRSVVYPGRESALWDRTRRLPWLRRLLLETESRRVTMTRVFTSIITGYAAFVDSNPHPPRRQSRQRYISEI